MNTGYMQSIIAPHQAVKSKCVDVAFKITKGKLWSRRDAEQSLAEKRKIKEVVNKFRIEPKIIKKTANVKKKKGGYSIVGFGFLEITKEQLNSFLKENGYSAKRVGGLVFNLK